MTCCCCLYILFAEAGVADVAVAECKHRLWLPLKVKLLLHIQAALLLTLTPTMPLRHKLRVIAAYCR